MPTSSLAEYSSPTKKLLRFFKSSRDGWKSKCMETRKVVRELRGTVHDVSKSRSRWKAEAMQLRARVEEINRELEILKNQ